MKCCLFLLFILTRAVNANSQREWLSRNVADELKNLNYYQLVRSVEMADQKARIEQLEQELAIARQNGIIVHETIERLRKETEACRKQMEEYMQQINELNEQNAKLSGELDGEN